jgi:hypothetical protein
MSQCWEGYYVTFPFENLDVRFKGVIASHLIYALFALSFFGFKVINMKFEQDVSWPVHMIDSSSVVASTK